MGAAMLWVMLFHSIDLEFGFPPLNWFRAAGFGGVDIFLVLSAVGLVASLSRREQEYSAFLLRRAGRVLPSYYLVMVPYTVFRILYGKTGWSSLVWNSLLLNYWVRPEVSFNWYVSGIMVFYAITPLCVSGMRRSARRERWTAAALGVSFVCSALLIQDGYWQYTDFFFRVPVFFLGLLMGFYVAEDRKAGWKDALFWCVWLAIGAVYILCWFLFPDELSECPLFLFTTVPTCLAGCWCFEHLPLSWLRRFLRFLGNYSLEIYLLNVSLFSETALLRQLAPLPDALYYPLSYACNLAAAVLLRNIVTGLKQCWTRRRHDS